MHLLVLVVWLATGLASAEQATHGEPTVEALIKQAIEDRYLFTEFDAAETILLDAVTACKNAGCPKETLARAWMYLGIVRENGLRRSAAALQAFDSALSTDPEVLLDLDLAGAGSEKLWALAQERARAQKPGAHDARHQAKLDEANRALRCTPRVLEALPGKRLPIVCQLPPQAERLTVHFLEFGEARWQRIALVPEVSSNELAGDARRAHALLPCSATAYAGPLRVYVEARASDGRVVESLGSKPMPLVIDVRADASVEHVLSNGKAPPSCKRQAVCPPGFPCADRGETCDVDDDCKEGLACQRPHPGERGACQQPKVPETTSPPAHWFGVHAGLDVLRLPTGRRLCSVETQNRADRDYDCYLDSKPYPDSIGAPAANGQAGTVDGGFSAGTLRALGSYSWRMTDRLGLGARAGVTFFGPPNKFMPVHVELEAHYALVTDQRAFWQPYAGLAGGLAEADAGIALDVDDQNHANGNISRQPVQAFTSAGPWFVALSLGSRLLVSDRFALQLEAQAAVFLPQKEVVLRPTLGVVMGLPGT